MQAVRQDMQLGVAPWDERAVHPDESVALIEGRDTHG